MSHSRINDEWISMDSPRLRPVQPTVAFEVGEQVLARWNDCRKFPATIKRVLDNGKTPRFKRFVNLIGLLNFRFIRRSL